jgi:hypothetical protein
VLWLDSSLSQTQHCCNHVVLYVSYDQRLIKHYRLILFGGSTIYTLSATLTLTTSASTLLAILLMYSLLFGSSAGTLTLPQRSSARSRVPIHRVLWAMSVLATPHAFGVVGSIIPLSDLLASEFVRTLCPRAAAGVRGYAPSGRG